MFRELPTSQPKRRPRKVRSTNALTLKKQAVDGEISRSLRARPDVRKPL